MSRRILCLTLLATIVAIGLVSAGCDTESPATLDEAEVRAYADPATETTLLGLSEGNLEKYTEYGDPGFKKAVSQELVDEARGQLESQLGSYVEKEFLSAEEYQEYIIAHYRATYTKGQVGVRMVFDQNGLVAGQFFE